MVSDTPQWEGTRNCKDAWVMGEMSETGLVFRGRGGGGGVMLFLCGRSCQVPMKGI